MDKVNRRMFLKDSGLALSFVALNSQITQVAHACLPADSSAVALLSDTSDQVHEPLYNTNLQTAIGLGDEMAGIIDRFGQLDSRNAKVSLILGTGPEGLAAFQWSQALEDGYLPIIATEGKATKGSVHLRAFASNAATVKADYLDIIGTDLPLGLELRFPFTTKIEVKNGIVTSGNQVLALFPPPETINMSQAKYNLLTPERHTRSLLKNPQLIPGLDSAFNRSRASYLFHPLEYSFPVQSGNTYHVVLGVAAPPPSLGLFANNPPKPGETLLKLSAGSEAVTVDIADLKPGHPFLHEFVVQATNQELRVKSETDPSATRPYRPTFLNAIWIFDKAVDLEQVELGKLSDKALFYVRCGQEASDEIACSVSLYYSAAGANGSKCHIQLPYELNTNEYNNAIAARTILPLPPAKDRWEELLEKGAHFITGDTRLDNLYKTSLINIFLLRTKYPAMANGGQDLYVVKPGASMYDAFWYRDGSYLTAALDVAGHSEEAEKSLRLFWQSNLPGNFGSIGQQQCGSWQAPMDELDSQGQALWALSHHFEFSGDMEWLRTVYSSIRRGALWIRNVTEQTRILTENGERPIYYGLLPVGEGEAIGIDYDYYFFLDYWSALGLRMAIKAAATLGEEKDVEWMTQTYNNFCTDLLASVKLAFQKIGLNKYIPGSPFQSIPQCAIWGAIAALYPTRFLDPYDPMISHTLDLMSQNCEEGEYTFSGLFTQKRIWTYITVDWAMCYLLRDDLRMFYKLYDGYVAHVSPTNAWVETISLGTRLGSGDMPHGWAAAQYVHLHRNSLVFEDSDILHLCWGAREDWLDNGIKVKQAPTKFGSLDFELRKEAKGLVLDYKLNHGEHQERCRQVQLHIPPSAQQILAVRVNGQRRALTSGQRVIQL